MSKRGSLEGAFATPPRRGMGLSAIRPDRRSAAEPAAAEPPAAEAETVVEAPDRDRGSVPASDPDDVRPEESQAGPAPLVGSPAAQQHLRADDGESDAPRVVGSTDAGEEGDLAVENLTVYVDQATLKALKAEKGREGDTYADVAERALGSRLSEVELLFSRPERTVVGVMPGRPKRQRVRGGIPIQLRFTRQQRLWLDEQTARIGAPNRSVVVVRALQLELGVPVG